MKKSQIEDLDPNFEKTDPEKGLRWYDIQAFGTEGQGWSDTQRSYARLPAKAEDIEKNNTAIVVNINFKYIFFSIINCLW